MLRRAATFVMSNSLLIASCIIVAAGSSIAYSQTQESVYKASAVINYRPAAFNQRIETIGSDVTSDEVLKAAVDADVVDTKRIDGLIAAQHTLTNSDIAAIEVTPQVDSDLIDIVASTADPSRAALLANSYASQYVAARRRIDRASARELIPLVRGLQANLGEVPPANRKESEKSLREVEGQLELLSKADTGNEFVKEQAATPGDPAEPTVLRSSALAALAGLLIGIAFAMRPLRPATRPTGTGIEADPDGP